MVKGSARITLLTGKHAIGFLIERDLFCCDSYSSKYIHYPLYVEAATTLCKRNYIPISV